MFSRYCYCGHRITIELNPEKSRKYMVASRDSLITEYNTYLEQIIADLRENKTRTLKNHSKTKKYMTRGEMMVSKIEISDDVFTMEKLNDAIRKMYKIGDRTKYASYSGVSMPQYEINDIPMNHGSFPISFMVEDEDFNPHIHPWYPGNWTWIPTNKGVMCNSGRKEFKLLKCWLLCCSEAVRCLLESGSSNRVVWSIGWCFGDEIALAEGDQENKFFMIRPINRSGEWEYDFYDRMSMKKMMSAAKHEVAHYVHNSHNENFSYLHTFIDSVYDERKVWERIMEMPL